MSSDNLSTDFIDFDVELIEAFDWKIKNSSFESCTNSSDFKKVEQMSIDAYYVDRWIDKVRQNTFKTQITDLPDRDVTTNLSKSDLPSTLPFDRCMVRYVHCSPKDSEFWGECKTPDDVVSVFNTSLRCHKNHGNKIVFRRWNTNIVREYRLFWNTRLCAGSLTHFELGTVDEDLFKSECECIIDYLKTINIPYYRCVIDVAILKDSSIVLIEFNSWESNSGCYLFDWRDTEIMYPEIHDVSSRSEQDSRKDIIIFRAKLNDQDVTEFRTEFNSKTSSTLLKSVPLIKGRLLDVKNDKISIVEHDPNKPAWWILHKNSLYVATDLFLVMFDIETFLPKIWVRHTNRFYPIFLTKNQNGSEVITAGDDMYDLHLTKQRNYSKKQKSTMNVDDRLLTTSYRYGFFAKVNEKEGFVRVCSSGRMYFVCD